MPIKHAGVIKLDMKRPEKKQCLWLIRWTKLNYFSCQEAEDVTFSV